jgi:hypothetical protein
MPLPGRGRPRFNSQTSSEPAKPADAPPPPQAPPQPAPPAQDFRKPVYKKRKVIRTQASSGMDPDTMKYIIYFLIFVVGNAILFFSTGYVIIPK